MRVTSLAAVDAKLGNIPAALAQKQAVANMSNENADALASQLKALEAGKNPFPANLLSVAPTPVNAPVTANVPTQ